MSTLVCALLMSVVGGARDAAASENRLELVFACRADNDLYRVMTANGNVLSCATQRRLRRLEAAPDQSGVLILADGYPARTTIVGPEVFAAAAKKKLRMYVEYPAALPGMKLEGPRAAQKQRAVVVSDFFGPGLDKLQILAIHGMNFLPLSAEKTHLAAAQVAGFDRAVFGLPAETFPLLFEHPQGNLLVATTKLSHFVTGRYAPQDAWKQVWHAVLAWLAPGQEVAELTWTPIVRPSYGPAERLPPDAEREALRRGAEWFVKSKLLVTPSRLEEALRTVPLFRLPTPPPEAPVGDGSLGIFEAPLSVIQGDGSQIQGVARRSDCSGESAMALAFSGKLLDRPEQTAIAKNLLDFWYFHSDARKKEARRSAARGLRADRLGRRIEGVVRGQLRRGQCPLRDEHAGRGRPAA